MRNASYVVGVLLVVVGLMVAGGMLKYHDRDKVADFGKLEIEATHEKHAPLNLGYILLGGGVLVLVGAVVAGRRG